MHELRLDFGTNQTQAQIAIGRSKDQLLREFLSRFPAQPATPIPSEWLDLPMREFKIVPVQLRQRGLSNVLDNIHAEQADGSSGETPPPALAGDAPSLSEISAPDAADSFSATLTDGEAIGRAYAEEIIKIGRYLSSDLSVLVACDKVLAEHVYRHAVQYSNKRPVLEGDPTASNNTSEGERSGPRSGALFQQEIDSPGTRIVKIGRLLASIKADQVLVLRHLDMLAGGSAEGPLQPEARLLTEVLYRSQEFTPTLLGFADPSVGLPKVLTDRFAVRVELAGLSRATVPRLVTRSERERFERFDPETLFKNVSGFNAIQLRNAMRYLYANSQPGTSTSKLMKLLREFKRGSSDEIEIPDVNFDQIGGYVDVKRQLGEAIELITGKRPTFNPDGTPYTAPTDLAAPVESEAQRERRRKLAPRGFIFHGPPGTGKTLFAKAIANAMNATIQMVSGPEIMDMWVGKSESNLRRLFTIARRNAPAVIFFDEFDSIAAQRGGFDGGSRASNAVVAQLLTELDGFHADQDILVIGTTNRLDIIDEALLRPSRFQPIQIDLPDKPARRQIGEIHAKSFEVPIADPYILDLIAEHSEDLNGDEIRAIFQELARDMRRGHTITPESFGVQIGLIRKKRDERKVSHFNVVAIRQRR